MTMLLGFYMDVPVTASIKYGGVRWSDKLLIYVLALQVRMFIGDFIGDFIGG